MIANAAASTIPDLTWVADVDGLSKVELYRWRETTTSVSVFAPFPRVDRVDRYARATVNHGGAGAFAYVAGGITAALDAAKELVASGEHPGSTIGVGTACSGAAFLVGMTQAIAPYKADWQRFRDTAAPFDRGAFRTRVSMTGRHPALSHIVNPSERGGAKPVVTPLAWYDGARS